MKYAWVFFGLLFVALGLINGCASREHTVLKLAHGLDPSHPVHRAMVFMAERVAEKSEGRLEVEIYPSEQLGSEQQCVELLQIGSLAMTKVSAAILEGFTDNYKVLGLPYIFRSKEHAFNVLDGEIGEEFLNSTEKFWIKGLCFYDAGSRSFYTLKRPIESPADLTGLKIRVMKSQTAMELVSAMGGSPTPVSWGELYTALQSGVVDGAENNPPSFYTSRHYEVCKYYSINEHTMVPDVLIISTRVWNKLTEQEQHWLSEAIRESVEVERRYWAESEAEALQRVIDAGVEINYPDKGPFEERVQRLYDSYKNDPEIYSLIQRIKAVQY
ncbi:MAG: TRAP transporter substrate-binding protein [Cyclobacteriaceae bacterium]|nr:TRAP transporter substrate-binding protein [Cyclobacteriaceae bacterium]